MKELPVNGAEVLVLGRVVDHGVPDPDGRRFVRVDFTPRDLGNAPAWVPLDRCELALNEPTEIRIEKARRDGYRDGYHQRGVDDDLAENK